MQMLTALLMTLATLSKIVMTHLTKPSVRNTRLIRGLDLFISNITVLREENVHHGVITVQKPTKMYAQIVLATRRRLTTTVLPKHAGPTHTKNRWC